MQTEENWDEVNEVFGYWEYDADENEDLAQMIDSGEIFDIKVFIGVQNHIIAHH